MPTGEIWLAATPIGNVADASKRLCDLLQSADVIAAEDTRRLRGLCSRLGIEPGGDIWAVHDHNEGEKSAQLVERALGGETVLLVSDAGTPTVSDPGYRVVQAALAAGVLVRPLPGPSAALAALSVSGLPSDRFAFEGFLPRKSGEARRRLDAVANDDRTTIWFESAKRLPQTLGVMAEVFGADRQAAVCRELTKTYEEVLRGTLVELQDLVGPEPRGEITIVVGGKKGSANPDDFIAEVLKLAGEVGLRAAAAQIAAENGLRKNQLYRAALEASEK
jgi:probable S-adenosylmethionine-dependent methyltransferase, YraL family